MTKHIMKILVIGYKQKELSEQPATLLITVSCTMQRSDERASDSENEKNLIPGGENQLGNLVVTPAGGTMWFLPKPILSEEVTLVSPIFTFPFPFFPSPANQFIVFFHEEKKQDTTPPPPPPPP
jgi:hypothetical protein